MPQAVLLPKLGQTVEEAPIVKWHKKEGDTVSKGEVLFEIETDKAVLEAESFFDGTLLKILVPEDKVVPVQSVVAYIGQPGEAIPDAPPAPAEAKPAAPEAKAEPAAPETKAEPAAPKAETKPAAAPAPVPQPAPAPTPPPVAPAAPPPAERLFISPRARSLAKASVIDPARITGSGPNGRIVERDVEAYLETHDYAQRKISPAAKRLAANASIDILTVRGTGIGGRVMVDDVKRAIQAQPRKLTKMRQIISDRLTHSFTTTPHFYVTVSVDMTDLFAFRQELKDQGKAYSVTDFIMEAVILSLQEMPVVNSVCDGRTIQWHDSVELGMAVGLDDGLVVPVIRDAQSLDLQELHDRIKDLAGRARDGKLMPDEMTGSSFTVSNMGMFDVDSFHAIINPGEGAILAVASTRDEVVVIDGEMKVRSRMKITLSVDHRIVDGTVAATFTNAVKAKLEDVELWKTLTS